MSRNIPKKTIGILALLIIWLIRGIWEGWIFGKITSILEDWGVPMNVINFIRDNQGYIVPSIAIVGIVIIIAWSFIDIQRKESGLYSIFPLLRKMEKRLWELANDYRHV